MDLGVYAMFISQNGPEEGEGIGVSSCTDLTMIRLP